MKSKKESCKLLEKCMKRAALIYGRKIPARITERLADEYKMLKSMDFADDFYRLSEVLDAVLPEGSDRFNVGLREGAGSFLISYLCGLSPYNPAEYLDGRFYPELYYGIILERKQKGMDPCFVLNVSADTFDRIGKVRELKLKHGIIRPTGNLSLLEGLERETCKLYFPSARAESVKRDDDNIRKAIWLAETEGDCFWNYVPLVKNKELIKGLSCVRDINGISNLGKLIGMVFGSGIWSCHVENMIREEENGAVGFDIGATEIITCPEDAYEYLSSHIKDENMVKEIALDIRCGNPTRRNVDEMRHAKCREGFIEAANKVQYLFERPACVGAATEIKRLAYYWNIDSKAYRRVYDKVI